MKTNMMSIALGMLIVGAAGTMEASAAPVPVRVSAPARIIAPPPAFVRLGPVGFRWCPLWLFRGPVIVIRDGC